MTLPSAYESASTFQADLMHRRQHLLVAIRTDSLSPGNAVGPNGTSD